MERNVQQQEHLQQAGKGVKGQGGKLGPWVVQGQLTDGFSFGLTAQAVIALAFPNTDREERRGGGTGGSIWLSNNGTKCSKLDGPKSASAFHNTDNITQLRHSLKTVDCKLQTELL